MIVEPKINSGRRGNNFTYEEMLIIGKTLKEIKANRIAK